MFENYVAAKHTKRRKWVTVLLSVSFAVHAIAVVALIIHGFWVIEKLTPPRRDLALAIAPPPPPPPPAAKKSVKKKKPPPKEKVVRKRLVKETTQPVDKKKEETVKVEIIDEDEGVEDGVDGVGEGIGGMPSLGMIETAPSISKPPPPPPPPPKPKVVPPKAIDAQRISGNKNIMPDESTKMQIQRDGKSKIIVSVKMCISKRGSVNTTRVVKSSGYPAYDRKIVGQMRQWKYAPFMINGKASPVCSSVMFVYVQN